MVKIKRLLVLLAATIIFCTFFYFSKIGYLYCDDTSINSHDVSVTAQAALVMEYDSGKTLWEKNSTEKLYPASTTKMLTAIIAIEEIKDFNQIVKISRNAAGKNNSFFAFKYGDKISVMDLIKAALIASHNNATIALAELVSGSESEFVKLMNKKALQIGLTDTNFENSNGLDSRSPEHKTTARDLAKIAKYCMQNEMFRKIVSTKNDIIKINGENVDIFNTNTLLFFDYVRGVKTGFTNNAGYCLVLYSERQGLNLLTVILNSEEGSRESDALKLIDWANDNYENKKIIDSISPYKLIEITKQVINDEISSATKLYSYIYPEKYFGKVVNIKDRVSINDNLKELEKKNINNDKNVYNYLTNNIYIPLLPVEIPLDRDYIAGKLSVAINNEQPLEINLVTREKIDDVFVKASIMKKNDGRFRNVLIFLISFYFLIFILIIIRNLILRVKKM
jgi:D-alanyl-D-alanine carboxypeptidase